MNIEQAIKASKNGMNIERAIEASRNGAIAAVISGAATLGFFLYAMGTNTNDDLLGIWNDPAIIVDIITIFVCAFGMFRKSRAAAIIMCLYWVLSKTYIAIESGETTGLVMGLVFLYFFGKAVQGTFAYHKIRKQEDPKYRAAPRWYYYVGIPSISLFAILVFYGLLMETDFVPSIEVISGSEVSYEDREKLVSNGIIYEDEEIDLFYSYGLVSVLEGGNILTNRAVVTYFVDENDELAIYEMTFDQIRSIELFQEGSFLNDTIYKVSSYDDENWFSIELPTEDGGGVRFVEELRKEVRLSRGE
jgi:hypothetical protein